MGLLHIPPLAGEQETLQHVMPEVLRELGADVVVLYLARKHGRRFAVFGSRLRPGSFPGWLPGSPRLEQALVGHNGGPFPETDLLSELVTHGAQIDRGNGSSRLEYHGAFHAPLVTQTGRRLGSLLAVTENPNRRPDGAGRKLSAPEIPARYRLLAAELAQAIANAQRFESLRAQAQTDELTGLLNKTGLLHRLAEETARASRQGTKFAVLVCDLDQLKTVNDTAGHLTGDRLLRTVGQLIRAQIRASDLAARFGGDEFVVVLTDADREQAGLVADRLQACLAEQRYPLLTGVNLRVTASIGAAIYPDDATTPAALLELADRAMYRAKARRKKGASDP